ncbi:type I polyketide synthase [Streptomyces sp. NPDC002537]
MEHARDEVGVAIIGMGCRFPGANGPEEFWRMLVDNTDAIREVPPERFDINAFHDPAPQRTGRTISRYGGFLSYPFHFDALFFGISPAEARGMDPQQRLLLQVVHESIEDSGILPTELAGSPTGVFVGQATAEYGETAGPAAGADIRGVAGSRLRGVTAGRVSYAYDLRGPSVVIDTACSSSLVAVHAARLSLLAGGSDLAVAAGVNLVLSPVDAIAYSQGDMLSPGGRCRFGDAAADGFVRSDGVGAVVLKRLADARRDGDPVLAVLHASAVTNDGRGSGLLLQPSAEGQTAAVRQALDGAGATAADLDYLEAHGTGTRVGDGVELRALAGIMASGRAGDDPLPIGSVKTNIGHTEAAAGMAGLIKAVLIARHRTVPASLHLRTAQDVLTAPGAPLRVVTRNEPLQPRGRTPLLGVSSFGISGTNAHVIVGGCPPERETGTGGETRVSGTEGAPQLLMLSARTPVSLTALARSYAAFLSPGGEGQKWGLRDICAAAARKRDAHPYRLWAVGDDHDELAAKLRALADGEEVAAAGTAEAGFTGGKRTVFVFPGQGSQWAGMGRRLMSSSPAFSAAMAACDEAVRKEAGWSVTELLAREDEEFPDRIDIVQPALWAVQVALSATWRSMGVEPDVCVGHSMGEVAAAHAAGGLTLEDAAAVICRRSRLMRDAAGRGGMLAVELSAGRARRAAAAYGPSVTVAAENAPDHTVLAGPAEDLAALGRALEAEGVFCRPVRVDVASHSPAVEPLRTRLRDLLAGLEPAPLHTPMVSTVHAAALSGPELGPEYWMDNLRMPVRFAETVRGLAEERAGVFVEVSAHPVLTSAITRTQAHAGTEPAALATLRRGRDERVSLAHALGALFAHGGHVDWRRHYGPDTASVPLPRYAWDEKPYRLLPAPSSPAPATASGKVRHVQETALADWGADAWGEAVEFGGATPLPPVVALWAVDKAARSLVGAAAWVVEDARPGAFVEARAAAGLRLRVVLEEEGGTGSLRAVVEALGAGAEPVRCLTARVRKAAAQRRDASQELEAALAACGDFVPPDGFLRLAGARGYAIAEPFRGIRQLWHSGDGVAVARVRVPGAGYPGVLESALHPLLAALPPGEFLPTSFESVALHAAPEGELWSVARCSPGGHDGGLRADVLLLDGEGIVLAEFHGIRLHGPAGVASGPLAAEQRKPASVRDVLRYAAGILELPAGQLDPRRPLRDFGLDSLMAVALVRRLRADFGLEATAGRLLGDEALGAIALELIGGERSEAEL